MGVLTKDKKKKHRVTKITANTVNIDDYVNPLSFDVDLSSPINPDEMPTIKPYNQDEIVYKETTNETKKDDEKGGDKSKKRRSKKQRKREKREKEKQRKKEKKKKKKEGKK